MIEILLLLGTLAVIGYYMVVWWRNRDYRIPGNTTTRTPADDVAFQEWVSDGVTENIRDPAPWTTMQDAINRINKRTQEMQDWRDPRGYL